MPRVHLTDVTVRSLKGTKTYTTYWDTKLPGFGVRVGLRKKTFVVMRGESRQRVTIGSYPNTELADARRQAKHLLLTTAPQTGTMKLRDLIDLFFRVRATPQNNKPRTIREYQRNFNRHLTPLLDRKLADITHTNLTRIIDGMAATPGEANHAFVLIRALFRFALQRRLIDRNPLEGMTLPHQPGSRDRVLSNKELRIVWQAAQEFPFPFGNIVALLITTGQRLSEISGLRWEWIDDQEMTITLLPTITKNSMQHTFPISPIALDIIQSTPRMSSFLFPSLDLNAAYVGHNKAQGRLVAHCNALLAKQTGTPDAAIPHWTLHDLRRTFATIHARIGTPPHVTEALLNHKTGTRSPIQRIYDRHTYLPEMRAAMSSYDRYLTELFRAGSQPVPQAGDRTAG